MARLVTQIQSISDLAKTAGTGQVCVPARPVKCSDPNLPLGDTCLLVGDDGNFHLEVRIQLPSEAEGLKLLISKEQIPVERLVLVASGDVPISVHEAYPLYPWTTAVMTRTQRFSFERIESLDPSYVDGESRDVVIMGRLVGAQLNHKNLDETETTTCSLRGTTRWKSGRKGFGGRIGSRNVVFDQVENDIEISITLSGEDASVTMEDDKVFFGALLASFVWLNGSDPGILFRQIRRQGRVAHAKLEFSKNHRSLKNLLVGRDPTGALAWSFLETAATAFSSGSPLTEDLRRLVWHYRDATADGPITTTDLLQACALLEGIVGLTLKHRLGLSGNKIKTLSGPNLTSKPGSAESRFFQASRQLGFRWPNDFEKVFTAWRSVRNSLAHGDLGEFDKTSGHLTIETYLRVLQAFNAIALRLIGFSGTIYLDDEHYPLRDEGIEPPA